MPALIQEWAALEARNAEKRWAPPEDSKALSALEEAGYGDVFQPPDNPKAVQLEISWKLFGQKVRWISGSALEL